MRVDLLPQRYCDALAKLYDDVSPVDAGVIRSIIEEELGRPIDEVFSEFDDEAVAAASFGQVHRVVLGTGPDKGTHAVIKVQRPDIERRVEEDGRLLLLLGWLIDTSSILGQLRFLPVFRDFVRWMRREMNYTQEAKNADRLYEETEWNTNQRIPYVYWEFTTRRVLTLEYLAGMPVSELLDRLESKDPTIHEELELMGCDLPRLTRHIYENFYLQAFIGKVFHADPHPGNLIVLPNNVIGYVDFGLLGRMSPESLEEQFALVQAVAQVNMEQLFVAVLDVLDAPRGLLVTEYFDAFAEAADTWLDACDNPGATIDEKSITNFVTSIMDLARAIGLTMSMNTTLYYKAMMSIDASLLRIWPAFDYQAETRQATRLVKLRVIEKYMSPNEALDRSLDMAMLLLTAPEFLTEQLTNYRQTTRRMYRKINAFPVIAAQVVNFIGLSSVGIGLALVPLELGYRFHLPGWVLKSMLFEPLLWAASYYPLFIASAVPIFWIARIIRSYSLVKVQREP